MNTWEIYVEIEDPTWFAPEDAALLKRAASAALAAERFCAACEIYITVADDRAIREMNRQFRDKDCATDVLSFPMYTPDELARGAYPEHMILGDIVISAETAEEQAVRYGHGRERELAFLTVHGVLHLLGYDHEKPDDETLMERRQEDILHSIGLTR